MASCILDQLIDQANQSVVTIAVVEPIRPGRHEPRRIGGKKG